jgi:tetratricopeptide (TPR) repeat protein
VNAPFIAKTLSRTKDAERIVRATSVVRLAGALLFVGSCVANAPRTFAADTIIVRSNDGRQETKITGEIVDWVGAQLTVRRSSGREEQIASERVVEVQSSWNEGHVRAEQFRAEGNYADALVSFGQAIKSERRAWVRRRILARLTECYAETGQIEQAGDTFAALIESDPQTPEFHVIPLNWGSLPPPASLETHAIRWLTGDSPPQRLIGASWLISSSHRNEASTTLRRLSSDPDARVAFLATAQSWRMEVATASDGTTGKWQVLLERMPEPLRAGPYFTLADALARNGKRNEAALYWMRIPILYPHQRQLAAEALWNAANQLERSDQKSEALTLYREIVSQHKDAPFAVQAEQRIAARGRESSP